MRDTFLSIDLDFWDCHTSYNDIVENQLEAHRVQLFSKIIEYNIPVSFYIFHHHMLRQINRSRCERIINVDFHSDLCGDSQGKLSEGSVFDHVSYKKKKTYIWLMPYKEVGLDAESPGRCDWPEGKAFKKYNWSYNHQRKTTNSNVLNMSRIKEVGVCISPDWTSIETAIFIDDYLVPNFPNNNILRLLDKIDPYAYFYH